MPKRSRPKSVTIKDIAAHLDMSHSTVSRALNDHGQVNENTKQRVREAAQELGYVPNLSARMIRGDYSKLIGLIIPDVQNDFYSSIARELGARCRSQGLRMLLAVTEDDPDIEESELRGLIEARVSGIVATLTSKPTAASRSLLAQVPCVQLVRRTSSLKKTAVCMDDADGCRAATEHLLALGHTNISYVGTSKAISAGKERLRGFVKAHELRGIVPNDAAIVLVPPRQEFGHDAVSKVLALKQRPTGLVIGSSELTIGGLRAVREANLKVPDDISIVGYGDPVWFDLLRPALTAVSLPVEALAEASIEDLFAQIESDDGAVQASRRQLIRIAPDLIIRDSTSRPARR